MAEIITVTADTLERHGFFCKMSARKTPAWQAKRDWVLERFDEGLQLRLLGGGERGFVEFMPGEQCWRAIEGAGDLVVIHCLWVVGKSRGKGFARALLGEVERWARAEGFAGVAALTSRGNWLVGPELLEHHGFRAVETAEEGFQLHVKAEAPVPGLRLSGQWADKAAACGPGVTVLRSAQCPYLEDAAAKVRKVAGDLGLAFRDVVIETAEDLRRLSPTPYGTYALVKDGRCLSYHYQLEKGLVKLLGG